MKRWVKILGWPVFAVFCVLSAWMIWSFFDISAHNIPNRAGYGEYWEYNFFIILERLVG